MEEIKRNNTAVDYSKESVRRAHRKMEGPLEQVSEGGYCEGD